MVKIRTKPIKDDKIIIGKEEDRSHNFVCEWCNCTLSRLVYHSGNNPSLYCSRCQMSFDPQYDNLRHEPKITTQNEDIEPSIAIVDIVPDVSIHKTPELRGGFAQLAKKGTIRFTSYQTSEKE